MAVLPARPSLSLDVLVARARAVQSAPAPSRPRSQKVAPPAKTLADLERASSIAAAPPEPAIAPPVALALWITIRRCACGSVTRCPPDYALVKYTPNAHSVHYSRAELSHYLTLPRELREREVSIPMCEQCFALPSRSEAPPAPSASTIKLLSGNAEIDALCSHENAIQDELCPDCLERVYAVREAQPE